MKAETRLVLVDSPMAGCAVVTLNRPEAMNALSLALREQLVTAIEKLRCDPSVRVLIITGAGKAFCAGLDLKELGAADNLEQALGQDPALDPIAALKRFPGPVIGAINGAAITGGFELALACDFLIATEAARFADTHARVGIIPGWGLSQRLSRLIGANRAKELSLTGNFLPARLAEAWGLVNRVVEPDRLLPSVFALATDMLDAMPDMLVALKRLIDDGSATTLEHGLEIERQRSLAWSSGVDPAVIEGRRKTAGPRGLGLS